LSDREWLPHSCESLKESGFCIIEDCEMKKSMKEKLEEIGIE